MGGIINLSLCFLLISGPFVKSNELIAAFTKVANFGLEHYREFNLDGLIGFVIAEAHLMQAFDEEPKKTLGILISKCNEIRSRILPLLPQTPEKLLTFYQYFMEPKNWFNGIQFLNGRLENLGLYQNWTIDDILVKHKHAFYKGVPSDHCLIEILRDNCKMSDFCHEMMLAARIDHGYLLTHRLFYLQVLRLRKCDFTPQKFRTASTRLCSLMLKEAKTNEALGYPSQDLFMEQMVLCGLEGYTEFLLPKFRSEIIHWQSEKGCFKSRAVLGTKRTSNEISFGCTDHSTGLGAAALALSIRYELKLKI